MIKTTVVAYKSLGAMQRDINKHEHNGFTVMSVTRNGQGWGVAKTVVLGAISLPLAIFGKKGDVFQVTYQRDEKMGFWDAINASKSNKSAKLGFWEQVAADIEAKKK